MGIPMMTEKCFNNVAKPIRTEIPHHYDEFYMLENGLIVRELNITAKHPCSAPVEIVQATDFHFNYCNARDFSEENPSVMGTYHNRYLNRDGSSAKQAANCMEYGSRFDLTVVTGDVLDYMSWGSLELMKNIIWDPHPDTLVLLGNHDPTRAMGLPTDIPDPTTVQSRLDILQDNWNHDLYYTSRIIKDQVMVIQMDDGQNRFWESQIDKLRIDLCMAREKEMDVLLFLHIPLSTGDPADTAVPYIYTEYAPGSCPIHFFDKHVVGGSSADEITKRVYQLIVESADVIRGVFTGHHHNDFYTEIRAQQLDGREAIIPQYTLTASFHGGGQVLKICVR